MQLEASGERPRFSLGLRDDTLVGGVGRLSPEKGFHLLLEAAATPRREGARLTVLLAGNGPQRGPLEERARALSVRDAVRFLGWLGDPRSAFAVIDIFVLPSLEEGSPNALLEAMACGRAMVAAAVGGVPEIIEAERSGLLVPPPQPGRARRRPTPPCHRFCSSLPAGSRGPASRRERVRHAADG